MKKEPYDYDSIWVVSVDSTKDQSIRKDNKEKIEYIRNELNTLSESDNYLDKVRYKILLKMVQ